MDVKEGIVHDEELILAVLCSSAVPPDVSAGGRKYEGTVLSGFEGGKYGELRPEPKR